MCWGLIGLAEFCLAFPASPEHLFTALPAALPVT